MKMLFERIKFEHVFAVLLLMFLSVAYFLTSDASLKDKVIVAVIGGFTMMLTFMFTKSVPGNSSVSKPSAPISTVIIPSDTPIVTNAVTAPKTEQNSEPPDMPTT